MDGNDGKATESVGIPKSKQIQWTEYCFRR